MFRTLVLGSLLLAFGTLGSNAVAEPPTLHADVFEIGAPEHCGGTNWCSTVAKGAMAQSGLMSDPQVMNFPHQVTLVAGKNNDAVVEVLCVPLSPTEVHVGIFAASDNRDQADLWRNTMSQRMKAAHCL
jgi:hypothetical protein